MDIPETPRVERRQFQMDRTPEVRQHEEDAGFDFEGHAAVFNELSEDLGFFDEWYERIAPGAFADVLGDDVRLLVNHDPNYVLARTVSETLTLSEDDEGLVAKAAVAPTSYAGDLRVLLDRGDVSQMSFAFRVGDESWEEPEEGPMIRTIETVAELFDVSVVTYPAYPQTDASARELARAFADEMAARSEPSKPAATPRLAVRRRRMRLL